MPKALAFTPHLAALQKKSCVIGIKKLVFLP
jgi:hypothetical protein